MIGAEIGLFWKNSLYSKLDPKLKHQNLILAFKELIKAFSEQKPTILSIEDGQWIDISTENFLLPMTREVENFPFTIIVTSRYKKINKKVKFKVSNSCKKRELVLKPLLIGAEDSFAHYIFGKGKLN